MRSYYPEVSVIEAVIFSALEKICIAIVILKSVINIVWDAFPVRDGSENIRLNT